MDTSEIEKNIKRTLVLLLKEFLNKNKQERNLIAEIIDKYSSQMMTVYGDKLTDQLQEDLEGFFDFHHWGDSEIKPSYTIEDVKLILSKLQR